jgi:hypothetical protein
MVDADGDADGGRNGLRRDKSITNQAKRKKSYFVKPS